MSTFTYDIKQKYPAAYEQFRKWWIEQVVAGRVPCDIASYGDIKSKMFDDWPFEVQALYYAGFFNQQGFTLSLALVTVERFEALVEACFINLQNKIDNEANTETAA